MQNVLLTRFMLVLSHRGWEVKEGRGKIVKMGTGLDGGRLT